MAKLDLQECKELLKDLDLRDDQVMRVRDQLYEIVYQEIDKLSKKQVEN